MWLLVGDVIWGVVFGVGSCGGLICLFNWFVGSGVWCYGVVMFFGC